MSQIPESQAESSTSSSLEAVQPEIRLCVAILRRSIQDYVLYRDIRPSEDPEKAEIGAEAAAWLFDDLGEVENEEGRYTFCYICGVMDLEMSYVRHIVRTLDVDEYRKVLRRNKV